MRLWAEPGKPDADGDIFTQDCINSLLKQGEGGLVWWMHNYVIPDAATMMLEDALDLDAPGLHLAPALDIVHGSVLTGEDGDMHLVVEDARLVAWSIIPDGLDPNSPMPPNPFENFYGR